MIDYPASAKLNNMDVHELELWLLSHPYSEKRVIRICDICGEISDVRFYGYSNVCHDCACDSEEFREKMSKLRIEYHKNNPDMPDGVKRMIGGNDLVDHHYIYDESDLSKNTVQMTRSDHTRLHELFKKIGYIVPHVNVND